MNHNEAYIHAFTPSIKNAAFIQFQMKSPNSDRDRNAYWIGGIGKHCRDLYSNQPREAVFGRQGCFSVVFGVCNAIYSLCVLPAVVIVDGALVGMCNVPNT